MSEIKPYLFELIFLTSGYHSHPMYLLAARRFSDQIVSSLTMFISELFVLNCTIFLFMSLLLLSLYFMYLTAFYLHHLYDYRTFEIRIK